MSNEKNVKKKIIQFQQEIFVIQQLILRDKKRNISSTFMGKLWEIVNPLVTMIVMVLVFGKMFGNDSDRYLPIYVLTGTTIYGFFTSGTIMCLNALAGNRSFLIKAQIKKEIYVLQKILFAFQNFLYSVIVYMFIAAVYRIEINWTWLYVIPDMILLSLMMYGIGKLLATINVSFADITYFYRIFTLMLMYGSALFYRVDRMAPYVQRVINLNPIYIAVTIARIAIIDRTYPPIIMWEKLIFYASLFYIVGTYIFNMEKDNVVAKL